MKKIYLAAMAVAALTVSSCSQDEVLNINPEAGAKAIEFGLYTGKAAQTRGTEVTTATIETGGFGVTAVYKESDNYNGEAPNFMYNQKVTKSGTDWVYDPVKYWPTTQGTKLTFFAYAPYGGTGITLEDNKTTPKTLTFELQKDPKNTVDFVAAAKYNVASSATPEKVSFTLKHELTRLAFKAQASEELYNSDNTNTTNKTKIVIKDVKFDKVDGKFYTKATYTYSDTDNSHGTWTGVTDAEYSINNLVNMSTITMGANGEYTKKGIAIEGTTTVDLFNANTTDKNYLFLIPTEEDGLAEEGDVKITFSYDIVTEDKALDLGYSITSAVKTVNLKKGALAQGKAYIYTFTFGVDKVAFSAEVDKWTESDVTDLVDYDDQK